LLRFWFGAPLRQRAEVVQLSLRASEREVALNVDGPAY